ncbi:EscU/YscU/HrcU family type III secretion system export apparatus switch protein [Sphingomonas baiyangensis]|uniref:Flagellar biosynthesis protein FlhB n=1 Tax=Sphingomonas baiyangensis TaxID=2572576 RepID=A0A4U1L5C6_9SPHN|nr:flagellar type III secretion system protein FlhB [Sphingomonas baiyangensis]TKD52012.1 flagellar biosynthesis protein FlhB [Sphingomonas baiyangensis]
MAETAGEKTEAPTPKRKKKAIEQGDVLKSKEFGAAVVILLGCGWLVMLGSALLGAIGEVMKASFVFGRADVEDFAPDRAIWDAGWTLAPSVGGLLALTFVAAIVSQAALGGLRFNGTLIAPKASRINPGAGLKRIFGPQGWIELGKSLLKVVLLGAIGWWLIDGTATRTLGVASADLGRALGAMGDDLTLLLFAMAGGLALIAGIDVPIQAVRRMGKLRMSKQEIKDEHKQTEGSPEAKGAQRQRQREMARGGMRKKLGEAHVVLTNPTHFAVALRYDNGRDQVPVVVAKGRGATALAIRDVAGEMAVPVLEYPTLARAVYYTTREGQEIRDDLYLAIATVLAFVFGVNRAAGGMPPPVLVPAGARFDENGNPTPDRA